MNISWVLADSAMADPTVDIGELKRLGAFWGSWCTWRAWQTDNVICHDQLKADELIKRNFQHNCNFYIPNSVYTSLNRPDGVRLYEGAFVHDVDRREEIVAIHLAATTSDIVLLFGFGLAELEPNPDRLLSHKAHHHRNHIRQAIKDFAQIQWVIVDHTGDLDPNIANLPNVATDSLQAVLALSSD
jgi:hypothetical protein